MPLLPGRDSCPPVSRNLLPHDAPSEDRRVGKSRMIQRAFGAVLAALVLPIAAGAAFDQPASPPRTLPFAANDSTQRNALGAAASNTDRNTVTRVDPPLAAVATAAPAAVAVGQSGQRPAPAHLTDGSCP